MMQKRNILWVAMILLGSLTISCMPDEDPCAGDFNGPLTSSEEDFLGSWKLTGMMADEEIDVTNDNIDNPSTDLFLQYGPCETTGVYTFQADRKYGFKQGTADDNCTSKLDIGGSWRLNGKTIEMTYSCSIYVINPVLSENNDSFTVSSRIQIADVNSKVIVTTVTYTYSRVL